MAISLGKQIQLARQQKGLSVAQLARKLEVIDASVRRWEADVFVPRPATLAAIAELLGARFDVGGAHPDDPLRGTPPEVVSAAQHLCGLPPVLRQLLTQTIEACYELGQVDDTQEAPARAKPFRRTVRHGAIVPENSKE